MARLTLRFLLPALAALTLSACFEPAPDTHPQQLVTKRNALFKQFTRAMEPMVKVTQGQSAYQREEFLENAKDLEKLSTKPWVYFTADGNYPPTRAKPAVWSQPGEFKDAQDKYLAQVGQLVKAAQGGDMAQLKTAVQEVTDSCKSCHKQFRNE